MDISYLHEFVILAETGNFLETSEILFISQSSLSKHIKAIESEVGCPLFDRSTRRVCLNEYGKTLLGYAKEIVNLQYQYTMALANQSKKVQHTLSIGSIPMMTPYHITDVIMKFKKEYKSYSVHLVEGESEELKELIRQNKCELAFIRSENEPDEEFTKLPYTTDRMVAVLPALHPLARKNYISLEELKGEDFLFLPPDSLLYRLCIKSCQEAGFSPNVTYTGKLAENILDLVRQGMGISLLMQKPIEHLAGPSLSLVPVTPKIETEIKICYKKGTELSAAAKHFLLNTL